MLDNFMFSQVCGYKLRRVEARMVAYSELRKRMRTDLMLTLTGVRGEAEIAWWLGRIVAETGDWDGVGETVVWGWDLAWSVSTGFFCPDYKVVFFSPIYSRQSVTLELCFQMEPERGPDYTLRTFHWWSYVDTGGCKCIHKKPEILPETVWNSNK
jgi:hypothetical protein